MWSSCPALDKPEGVKDVTCESATCMAVCEDGKVAMGQRRIKCRWKRKKGFFWKKVFHFFDEISSKLDFTFDSYDMTPINTSLFRR